MMTAFEELSVPKPRPPELCRRYARKLDPWWGFIIAGVIWTIYGMALSVVLMIQIMGRLNIEDGSSSARIASIVTLVVGGAAVFLSFRWWRLARLREKELLVREGDLLEMEVVGRPFQISKYRTTVDLAGSKRELRCAFNKWFSPRGTLYVLHQPMVPHVVAFDRDGGIAQGHVVG